MKHLVLILSFGMLSALTLPAFAGSPEDRGDCDASHAVVRQTVPYPQAVRRAPLTSDQLDTASTRLIDARRGYRSYDSVHGHCQSRRSIYRDHFGIIRPIRTQTPRARQGDTGVTTHRGSAQAPPAQRVEVRPLPPVDIDDQRLAAEEPAPKPVRIVIHDGEAQLPQVSGAVIIKSDGTVISIGE